MAKSIPEIVDLASAFYGSAVLFSSLELGIFNAVEECGENATVDEIAAKTGLSERGLKLLLNACVAEGILEKEGSRYQNTPAGRMALISGSPADLSKAIRYNSDVYPLWGRLSEFVKSGKPVEPPKIHLGADPTRTRAFALSMRGRAFAIGKSVIPMIDLTSVEKLLDLAGGPGAYAELLAKANPGLSCVTVDLPAISAVAKECIDEAGLSERIECRPGDYHSDEYENGEYDAVTIFGALHQESPEDIDGILARANRALKKGGKIFILDMMTDDSYTAPKFSALFGLNMALSTENGRVFSDTELKKQLDRAGFDAAETKHVPPPMPHWLVTGVKR